jgi:hypothetical protein
MGDWSGEFLAVDMTPRKTETLEMPALPHAPVSLSM